jgi:hypothetical protein
MSLPALAFFQKFQHFVPSHLFSTAIRSQDKSILPCLEQILEACRISEIRISGLKKALHIYPLTLMPSCCGWAQTLDLRMTRQAFYHCAKIHSNEMFIHLSISATSLKR